MDPDSATEATLGKLSKRSDAPVGPVPVLTIKADTATPAAEDVAPPGVPGAE
jgi:hypothetical protein